ncbi:MAG: hypothetical protein FH753_11160 [Firmicutes bacterium]|nr:hypothetical protein [Bacillota bacterium]
MRWVKKNSDLYRLDNGKIIEIINTNDLEDLLKLYAEKFEISAYKLTEHLLESVDISKLDIYFFSVAYLFRQSIELILKALAFKYIRNKEDRIKFLKLTKHNLYDILIRIKPYIESDINVDKKSFDWLISFFDNINDIDKKSDAFRYPFGISIKRDWLGEKVYSINPVLTKQTHIDLVKFANKMLSTYEILNSLYNDVYGTYKRDESLKPILIEEGGSYYSQSVVGYKHSFKSYYPYIESYTNSAEYVYSLTNNDDKLKEFLFIPMCYLYRNAVELSLKAILIEECSLDLQEALKQMNKKKHKIVGLWNLIKDEIKEHASPTEGDKTLENAFMYLRHLNNFDVEADKFRYPFSKNLNIYFDKKHKFDIDNVNNFFKELLSFLSGVKGMMSYHNEIKAEWQSEMRSERLSNFDRY